MVASLSLRSPPPTPFPCCEGRVSFVDSSTVLVVKEMTDIISPNVRIGSAAAGRDEQAERHLKTWRLWSGRVSERFLFFLVLSFSSCWESQLTPVLYPPPFPPPFSPQVEGEPSSWVTFVARAAGDAAAVEVDGTVRYADGAELLLSGGSGSAPIDVEAKAPPPLQAEPTLLDHTYTFKSQQPGGGSGESVDLDAASKLYTDGRHPELDDANTATVGAGTGDRGRRAVPVTMDNLTACEVFVDADANFVSHMASRPASFGGARATAQAREQYVLTRLLFAQDLFTQNFGTEVHLSFRGYAPALLAGATYGVVPSPTCPAPRRLSRHLIQMRTLGLS